MHPVLKHAPRQLAQSDPRVKADNTGALETSANRLRHRYLRLAEVRQLVPLSPATIWRKTRDGSFPPAIKLSERITAWNREAVEAWLAAKEAA